MDRKPLFTLKRCAIVLTFTAVRLLALLIPSVALSLQAQMLVPEQLTVLNTQMNETSGLIVLGDAVWTILDSGAPAEVYEVDPSDGSVLRTVQLTGAANTDFEDITADADWVYVGDFGNNLGSRPNLRIYRFPRAELENESTTQVAVDVIDFSFEDQTDFTPAFNATNFDCEAFVATGDSLFLFTKRWLDQQTKLYALPALPGDHVAEVRATLDTDGVVTAASWDGIDRLALLGHEDDPGQPFIWLFNGVEGADFFGPAGIRRPLDLFDHQVEGIAWRTPDEWIISNELLGALPAALWSVEVGQTIGEDRALAFGARFFPNPAGHDLYFDGFHGRSDLRISNDAGRVVLTRSIQDGGPVDVSTLAAGSYIAIVISEGRTYRSRIEVLR